MSKCRICRHKNRAKADFCEKCGAKLDVAPEMPAETPRPVSAPADSAGPRSDDLESKVVDLLKQGRKIPAVKLYREHHDVGLKEAKEGVEEIGRAHGIEGSGSGCGSTALALVLFAVILAAAFA